MVWMEEENGNFSVKSLFKLLDSGPSFYFPANTSFFFLFLIVYLNKIVQGNT